MFCFGGLCGAGRLVALLAVGKVGAVGHAVAGLVVLGATRALLVGPVEGHTLGVAGSGGSAALGLELGRDALAVSGVVLVGHVRVVWDVDAEFIPDRGERVVALILGRALGDCGDLERPRRHVGVAHVAQVVDAVVCGRNGSVAEAGVVGTVRIQTGHRGARGSIEALRAPRPVDVRILVLLPRVDLLVDLVRDHANLLERHRGLRRLPEDASRVFGALTTDEAGGSDCLERLGAVHWVGSFGLGLVTCATTDAVVAEVAASQAAAPGTVAAVTAVLATGDGFVVAVVGLWLRRSRSGLAGSNALCKSPDLVDQGRVSEVEAREVDQGAHDAELRFIDLPERAQVLREVWRAPSDVVHGRTPEGGIEP